MRHRKHVQAAMPTTWLWAALAAGLLIAAGCGVPQERFDQVQSELADSQASLASCIDDRTACDRALADKKAEYNEARRQLARVAIASEVREKALEELTDKFARLKKQHGLEFVVRDGRMTLDMPADVLFAFGRATLSDEGRRAVLAVGSILTTIEDRSFQIAGHTDAIRGAGPSNPNWDLSYARAKSVFDVLKSAGVKPSRLSLAAYAEYSPVATNETTEGRTQNRRVELVLLPTAEELPLRQLEKVKQVEDKVEDEIEP